MASAETEPAPSRHLDERPPDRAPRPPSPRDGRPRQRREGGDSYRPGRQPAARRERSPPPVPTEEQKQAAAKAEYERLLNMRSGGTYIPPARLRALQAQITDKTSKEYQRMAWEALKKSINGLINKVNVSNIKHIVPELFGENLVRGRGLYCQSIMKAQSASLPFTPIYAAMTAIVNTKLPQVGEMLVKRLCLRFRKAFRRNDKAVCVSATTFLAHLVNHQVCHEMLAAQMLLLLLNKPTDDSVEIAVGLMREVGQYLEEMNPQISMAVFDQFRNILHEADIDKRTQYAVEVLFQIRKDRFKDNPAVKEELDLVEEEDQIKHIVELDGDYDGQDSLNIFKFDPNWEENEAAYKRLKAEILGEGSDDDDDGGSDESSEDDEDDEQKAVEIKDQSNADLVNLRRTIYLTLMSSVDPEEAVHKLLKLQIPAGSEKELPEMVVECCAQEKTYSKFYGLIAERLAKINRLWLDLFERGFTDYYEKIHRYDTNKLRNIARLFGHMFASDALGWYCLGAIHLNEEETTSASRIFIKILFQEIAEETGMAKLQARMRDETLRPNLEGLFPRDNPRNIRFSINYFTSIGMGALTEEMREQLQNMPKPALPAPAAARDSDSDSVSSYSSYTGSSYSSQPRSQAPPRRKVDRGSSNPRFPPPRARGRSYSSGSYSRSPSASRSRSPPPARGAKRGRSDSRTPPRRGARGRSYSASDRSYSDRSLSRSRSPPPRRGAARRSLSRSPPPKRAAKRFDSRSRPARTAPAARRSLSRSPPPRRAAAARSISRSRSPPPRRAPRSVSRSASPPPRRQAAARAISRSASPPPRRAPAARPVSRSPSPPSPPRGGGRARGRPYSRSPSRSPTRSRSPPPPARGGRRESGSPASDAPPRGERRRRNSSSVSSVPRKRYRRSS